MQKIFKLNKNNKIEFTREELKALLDEVYQKGYQEGESQNWYWNSPWQWNPVYTTTATNKSLEGSHLNIPDPSSYN